MKNLVNLNTKLLAALFALVFALILSSCDLLPWGSDDDDEDPGIFFTVTFNTGGGSTVEGIRVQEGRTASRPANPSRSGYAFLNWYTDPAHTTLFNFPGTPIYSNTVVYARWEARPTVRIRFNTHGAEAMDDAHVYVGGPMPQPQPPDRFGWRFEGWYTTAQGTNRVNFHEPVTTNRTIHARWTLLGYIVTFDARGGSPTPAAQVVLFTTPTSAARANPPGVIVSKTGHTHDGWYNPRTGDDVDFNYTVISGDVTFHAKWDPFVYRVIFNGNGGDITLQGQPPASSTEQQVNHGDSAVRFPNPTRSGHNFVAWFTVATATGGTEFQLHHPITSALTVYARWEPFSRIR